MQARKFRRHRLEPRPAITQSALTARFATQCAQEVFSTMNRRQCARTSPPRLGLHLDWMVLSRKGQPRPGSRSEHNQQVETKTQALFPSTSRQFRHVAPIVGPESPSAASNSTVHF
jgi:hypothetical protein